MAELWRSRELVRTLVERDLRVRYKRTVLGFGWAVLTPVVFMLVFTLFFQRAGHFATGGVPYALFVYTVLVPWTFFAQSLTLGSASIIGNLSLLNKVYCPREVFPIAAMLTAAFDTAIATLVLLVLFPIYDYPPSVATVWVPLLIAVEVAFTLGFTLFVASVLIYLRDLRYIVPIAIQILLFASPVVYALTVIPAGLRPAYAVINPLGPVLDGFRRTVLHGLAPEWGLFCLATLAAVIWLIGGYYTFKRLETGFADIA
jgi:ABC-2 type transport system permease protein/lipopolysaccharide transport system permease protein